LGRELEGIKGDGIGKYRERKDSGIKMIGVKIKDIMKGGGRVERR
jgi:hypothetical protein